VYGIDMPTASELIAHGRDEREIERVLGADWLIYQDLEDLIDAVQRGNPRISGFDTSCFDGKYVTGDVTRGYLDELEQVRSDARKREREEAEAAVLEL
jgi:amidophosphoribosyltransferase